jgi:predicted PurR-regulated permease PerM
MSDLLPPSQRPIQSYVLAAILVLLLIAVLRLIAPFFTPLLWAILLYILMSPLHRRLIKNLHFDTIKGKFLRNFWAAVFTLGTVFIILFPISVLATIFFRQALELGYQARNLLNERPEYLRDIFEKISGIIRDISAGPVNITADDIEHQLRVALTNELQRVVLLSGNIVKYFGTFFISMLFISFSVFFFYVDGPYLVRLVWRAVPIKNEYISALTAKFLDITRSLIFGYIIVALLQSIVAFIVYTIFGISGALVFAVATFILVFIPGIGATIVWVPLGIVRIVSGDIAGGILFMIISMVFISGVDNVLRPIFLKDRIQLHPFIIFFAILGGIFAFGFNGFILGPILVIFFLTVLDLFLLEHKIGSQEQTAAEETVTPEKKS